MAEEIEVFPEENTGPVDLRAPFPWFGGKSRVAGLVWERFGPDLRNYVEPFAGSLACLLGAPYRVPVRTVNDLDGYIANFWRALIADPDGVAHWADWPVNEVDLHARHCWLVKQREDLVERLAGDPDFYDAKLAGWWVWGISCWIGCGWCSGNGPWQAVDGRFVKVTGDAGQGVNRKLPHLGNAGRGVNRKLPHLGNAGRGVNRKRPHLSNAGQGVNRKRPHLSNAGQGVNRKLPLQEYMRGLAEHLREVRVCQGSWDRVCGQSVTFKHGMTGVFLDPPYDLGVGRAELYTHETQCSKDVFRWCVENGDNPLLRIALCGYESEHDDLEKLGWECVPWKAHGGYGNQGDTTGRANAHRERIWFSPACLKPARVEQPAAAAPAPVIEIDPENDLFGGAL